MKMIRKMYTPRKMLTPDTGTVEYKTCGLEGLVPTATQIASGLCEIGAYVNKLTGSCSSIMDYLVKYNVDGHPVATTATDAFAQAGIVIKAMKDTTFSGSDENNARNFEIWFAPLLSAANSFPFLLELIVNCRGHPCTDKDGQTVYPLWPDQYVLEMYSEARTVPLQQPPYPYPVWMKHKLHIADGSPFNRFTDQKKAIAASATNMAKSAARAASVNVGETTAQQNAAVAAVPATTPVSTAVATAMLKSYQCFEYSLVQRSASQTLYLSTNNAFYNILGNATKEHALAYVLTCKWNGFRAFQGLLKQTVEVSVTFYMDRLGKMQTFRFHPNFILGLMQRRSSRFVNL